MFEQEERGERQERREQREQQEHQEGYFEQSAYAAQNITQTQTEPTRRSLSHSSYTDLAIDSSAHPSFRFSRPLPLPLPSTDPTLTPMPPLRVSPAPPPLRIARKKPPPIDATATQFITAGISRNNIALSPPTATVQLPNTASTSASMSEGESSSYIPTPPLTGSTNSPPLTSHRLASVEDRSSLPRPGSVHFGPRPARNSKRVPSSLFFDQRRGVEIPSAEEFGVYNTSHPVVFAPKAPQYTADEFHTLADLPTSPTPSLPNPYTTSLTRTGTASSIASSALSSGSHEFGPRPRVKPVLTLSHPDSKAAVSIASIAIDDMDASLPNPFQPPWNSQSYFSPHLPQDPPNRDSLIQPRGTSRLGEDVNTGFGVNYISPHTPATTDLLSSIRTGHTTTIGTGPIGTKREYQDEKGSGGRASELLVVPPSAAIGSYWSPHTPDVPEGVGRAMDEAVVKEPGEISSEFLKVDYKIYYHTPTTDATDGHSVERASTSPRDLSPRSSNDAITYFDLTASDSSSPFGNRGLVPTNSSKPQLKIQTWDLDKMRDDKKRQETTAVRRQGSKDKDARNRERKGRGKTVQKEAETVAQTTEGIKGVSVPQTLKPGGVPFARFTRSPQQVVGSSNTPGGLGKSELALLPASLRPGSQLFEALPPPAYLALRSQPVLDITGPPTQGVDTSASLTQNRRSIATANDWGLMSHAPLQTPITASLSLGPMSNSDTDRFTHGRSPSEPTFPNVSLLGPGGTQEPRLGKEGKAKERTRFSFFGNTGGAASDTNLAELAASGAKKSKDTKDVNDLKEDRKNAFYSRGINASFEALAGWGGKIFSSSSTSVNTYGASSKKGETDEKLSTLGTTVPPPVTAQPHPYAQYQIPPLSTPPAIDTQYPYTPPLQPPASNTRVHAAPLYPSGRGGPSFEDLGVEVGWAGKHKTHMTPHSSRGHGAATQEPAVRADAQQMQKGHTKNSSSGVSGFMRVFGFGKKDKGKDKQKLG